MAETKTPTNSSQSAPPKVFDVAKPGKSAPAATSKPVIITNRPILQDPMVIQNASTTPLSDPAPGDSTPAKATRERNIAPLKISFTDGDAAAEDVVVEKQAAKKEKSKKKTDEKVDKDGDKVLVISDSDEAPQAPANATEEEELELGEVAVEAVAGPPALPAASDPDTASASETPAPGPMIADVVRKAAMKKEIAAVPEESIAPDEPAVLDDIAAETDETTEDTETPATADTTPEEPVAETTDEPAAETAAEPAPVEPAPEAPEETPAVSDSIPTETEQATSADGEPVSLTPLEQEKQRAAETAAKEAAEAEQKLIDSQQYFLPINAVERRKTKRHLLVALLVIVVLAIAWGDLAMDAGILNIKGVNAPTHFFKNSSL